MQTGMASAGLSTASLGLLGGDTARLFTPQDSTGMDMDWLGNLKLLSDNSKRKRSTNKLRPDCYIEVDKKFDDMNFQELSNGMNGVADYISNVNSPRISLAGYSAHMRFVSLKAQGGAFPAKALAKYDHKVVSAVLEGDLHDFVSGYKPAIEAHLSAEHMGVVEKLLAGQSGSAGQGQGQGSARSRRNRQKGGGAPRSDNQRDWPPDICWKWNTVVCDFDPCYKKHICLNCRGQHKSRFCRGDADNTATTGQQPAPQQQQQQHYQQRP